MRPGIDATSSGDAKRGRAPEWTADRLSRGSLRTLRIALREITETLARELAHPTDTVPEWSAAEWALARAVAAIHGISPLLGETLRWSGPPTWTGFLAEQRSRTAERFLHIRGLLQQLGSEAARSGIALLPLKGAALHALGIYRPGERPMADLDLLVRPDECQGAAELLSRLDFLETHRTWKHRVFARSSDIAPEALGEGAHNGIKIELHSRVAEALPRRAVDISAIVFPKRLEAGLNAYPSNSALL